MVETFAALGRPLQELHRAVDGDALLVAGDQQRNRAFFRLAAIGAEIVERRRDETGDAALHVDGAAAVKLVACDLASKRRVPPGRLIARRHHIGMAGEHQIGFFRADAREQILDRRGAGLGENGAMDGKSRPRQHLLQIGERPALHRA